MQVPDEEEIRAKTQQIAVEYEKKMQKMAAELAEARVSSERTAAEMDRLKAEAEEKQRQLYADFTVRAQSERVQLTQQFDAEMERVQRELDSTRRGKDLVEAEMDSLRRQYQAALFSVENSVPPQQLAAERDRLRAEYEANMKTMRDELDAVKTSRANVQSQMETLKTEYETQLSAGRSAITVASVSTSTALLSIATDHELRQQNLTDEMKIVSADRFQTDERASATSENTSKNVLGQQQSGSDASGGVQSKLVKDSLSKYLSSDRRVVNNDEEPSSIDVEQLERDATADHEAAVSRITTELGDFKRSRDDLAKVIHRIKTAYQEAVWRAHETVPMHEFDAEKEEIRATYEVQMDPVKEDLRLLKSHRDIVTKQLAEQKSAWKKYEDERQKIAEDVEAGRVERGSAPGLIKAAVQLYFEETGRLSGVVATEKEKAQTRVINERFEREKRLIEDDVETGKLTETDAVKKLDQIIQTKTAELAAVREQAKTKTVESTEANNPAAIVVEAAELNVNRKSSMSVRGDQSSRRDSESGSAMERRLKTLENILIHGGRDITGGGTAPDTQHCSIIREKLRREKQNAEEKQRKLQEAHKCASETTAASALYSVFASAHDEIVAKTTALEQLRSQNEHLRREINDIQARFSTFNINCK